jgi:hypothetical protein
MAGGENRIRFLTVLFILLCLFSPTLLTAETVVENFETEPGWNGRCINAEGGIRVETRIREAGKGFHDGDNREDNRVLGIKMEITALHDFAVEIAPERPLTLPEGARAVSLLVWGNNFNNLLTARLTGEGGLAAEEVYIARTTWYGWKEVTFHIPPRLSAGPVDLEGFIIYLEPLDLMEGRLYYYFDDLSVR